LPNWGKRKNASDGGFGRVFIGSRAIGGGRAVHNDGRDVAQSSPCPPPVLADDEEDDDGFVHFVCI
jgi:hypothetical protein